MNFIQGVGRQQCVLFAETIDDAIDGNNPVRFIDAFVSTLDLVEQGFSHAVPCQTGRPPYDPADLLKLYVYGYVNKIRSSRLLERATYQNIEVMWLIRKLHPDFKTIADFRKDNIAGLKGVCRTFTLLCKDMELFGGELIAIDGSKFSAVNHNSKCYTKERLRKKRKDIEEKVNAYLAELERSDTEELPDDRVSNLQEKIAVLLQRKQKYEQYQEQLEETGETQVSLTDPDCRLMKASTGRVDASYNVQIATDSKHKLIVAYDVTNSCSDEKELSQMALKAQEILDVEQITAIADTGYYSEEEIRKCDEQQITCYISPPKKSTRNKKLGLYTVEDFSYDQAQHCYVCPAGQLLTYRGQRKRNKKVEGIYASAACRSCLKRSSCTRSKRDGRRMYRWEHEHLIEEMRERLRIEPDKIKLRSQLVEHPFGTLKWSMNHQYFLLRGKLKVGGEMAMSVLAYNMKRVINILGIPKLIELMKKKMENVQKGVLRAVYSSYARFCLQLRVWTERCDEDVEKAFYRRNDPTLTMLMGFHTGCPAV
jgi:transposase